MLMPRRALVVVALLLGVLALAAPASASSWSFAGGTLTITPSSGESVSLQANAGTYRLAASDTWARSGPGATSGFTAIAPQTLDVSAAAVAGDTTVLAAITVLDNGPVEVSILGVAPSVAWTDPLTVTLTDPDSTLTFDSGDPVAPISFGTSSVTATAPLIAVRQEITAASSISLTGTAAAPSIHADVTAAPTGAIILNGARVTTYGFITLAAGYVQTTGPVVGATGCFSVEIGCRAAAPSRLTIDGNLITEAPWSNLVEVQVSGTARLGGDVTTSGVQEWQDAVYVTASGTLTLSGSNIITPKGIEAYAGPCGGAVITGCGFGSQSPPARFSDLVVNGDWGVGGSVRPTSTLRATGLTTALGTGADSTFAPTTSGAQTYAGGLSIAAASAAMLSGSSVTIAGMPEQVAVGGVQTTACDTGPLTIIGALQLTGAVDCLDSLIVSGPATIAADVTTQRYQSYLDAATLALGTGSLRLRAGVGQTVAFRGTPVVATWSAASGADITGYTATIASTGQACSTTGALSCSFGSVAEANTLTFSAAAQRRPSSPSASPSGSIVDKTATTTRRTVARGSRTTLTKLITPPAVRGKRTWSERGQCAIDNRMLVAPKRRATCMLTLKIQRGGTVAWTGRATIAVR
ncbi:MAG: hypothetical protein WCN97_01150 [Thermoleophilia bacterium]